MLNYDRSRRLFILIAALVLVIGCANSTPQPDLTAAPNADQTTPTMDTLVTTQWLSRHLDDPDLVVLDCTVRVEMDEDGGFRKVSGRADYEDGHIPSAGFADLMGDLSDGDSPHDFAVPSPRI